MKKRLLTLSACLLLCGTVGTADELAGIADGWTGLYGGIQAGYLWGRGEVALNNIPTSA